MASEAEERSSSLRGGTRHPPVMADVSLQRPFSPPKYNPVFEYNCRVIYKKMLLFISVLLVLLTGCDATPITPTVRLPEFVTATLPPTALPVVTSTALPPTIAPTIVPIAGRTTTQVNVRAETSTASASLGTLPAFSPVQVTGKDASGLWVQIIFNSGTGWVSADYIQAEDATAEIPVVGAGAGNGSAGRGVILRGVNVRSGPGTDFESLGLLNQNDVVPVLGKDSSGAWFQIEYAPAADGKGWVAADFLQVENAEAVTVINEEPQATELAATQAVQIEPLARTAWTDNDSMEMPLAIFTLATNAAGQVQFQGDVSTPDGDGEDWLGFSANSKLVVINVSCESAALQVELIRAGETLEILTTECNGASRVQIQPGQIYLLRISPLAVNAPVYIGYIIKIELIDA